MIELYDHEVIAIDKGPVAWMTQQQGSAMSLEEFRIAAEGKFADIGILASVKTFETSEPGTYAFDVEIYGRTHAHEFDFDRQVHEVVNNLLDDPGQEKGFINTEAAARELKHSSPDAGKTHRHGS